MQRFREPLNGLPVLFSGRMNNWTLVQEMITDTLHQVAETTKLIAKETGGSVATGCVPAHSWELGWKEKCG